MNYKLVGSIIFLFLIFHPSRLNGQNAAKQQLLIAEAQNSATFQPNESLKIALLLLKGSNTNEEKVKLNLLISKIYSILGDYTNAANYLFDANTNIESNSVFQKAKINIEKTALLKSVFLHKQSNIYLNKARYEVNNLTNQKQINEIKSLIILEELELLLNKQEYKKAKGIIQKNNYSSFLQKENISKKRFLLIQSRINNNLGDFHNNIPILESSKNLITEEDKYFKIQVWNEIAKNYFYQQNYSKAIEYALNAEKMLVKLDNIYLLENTTEILVLSYLALNKEEKYKLFNAKLLTIKTEIEKEEEEALNTVYNLINSEYQTNYSLKKTDFTKKLYLSIGLFLLFSIIFGFVVYKKYAYKKRLTEIFSYLKVTNKNILSKVEKKEVISKKNSIPAETEQQILNKLKKFESSLKYTNKDISLAVLAGNFETNTKYLSEIINQHYHINFNTYINKLRVNFIIEKLRNEPNFCNYKISYLAELSGFSSHSSFATVFKSISGISPITFIDILKNERNDTQITPSENE
jgi:AraC-like DNA-binding protein